MSREFRLPVQSVIPTNTELMISTPKSSNVHDKCKAANMEQRSNIVTLHGFNDGSDAFPMNQNKIRKIKSTADVRFDSVNSNSNWWTNC